MIYNIDGSELHSAFDRHEEINQAYDISGNLVYTDTIKVMTYNVGQWYEGGGTNVPADKDAFYYNLQNGMLTADDPDVLCIEEYWKVFSQTGRTALSFLQPLFPYIHEEGGNSGYFGRCICSKYPITNYTNHYYSNDAQRYYDSCTISVNGKSITVIVTHLGLTVEDRQTQISELITYLSSLDTFICCGDYNTPSGYTATPSSKEELSPFFSEGFNLANCDDLGDFITSYGTSLTGWRGWIDNICVSSDMSFISANVDEAKIVAFQNGDITKIDHMPFMATIQL